MYSYSEEGRIAGNSVCHINGLMRVKLLPDSSKLIVCTTSGFILLINNLNLETLADDIQGFKVIFFFFLNKVTGCIKELAICYTDTWHLRVPYYSK